MLGNQRPKNMRLVGVVLARFTLFVKYSLTIALVASAPMLSSPAFSKKSAPEHELRAAIIFSLLQLSSWETREPDHIAMCEVGNNSETRNAFEHTLESIRQAKNNQKTNKTVPPEDTDQLEKIEQPKTSILPDMTLSPATEGEFEQCDVTILGPELSPEQKQHLASALDHHFVICNGCERHTGEAVIHLFLHENSVRYNINVNKASELKVHFRSEVLRLALNLRKQS